MTANRGFPRAGGVAATRYRSLFLLVSAWRLL